MSWEVYYTKSRVDAENLWLTEPSSCTDEATIRYQGSTKNMVKTVYFGNLPWSVTDEDLNKAVTEYAEVISARIATDRETGRSRGFGFVEVPEEKMQAVIDALNGAEWEGRVLTVNEAKPREDRGGSRGGGRGGFGGGRRF